MHIEYQIFLISGSEKVSLKDVKFTERHHSYVKKEYFTFYARFSIGRELVTETWPTPRIKVYMRVYIRDDGIANLILTYKLYSLKTKSNVCRPTCTLT